MRVLHALLCEDARPRGDGRTDVSGIFHQLYARDFPARQDRLVLVATLQWDETEAGRTDFRIDLLDPGESPTLTISGHTDVMPRDPRDAPPQTRIVMPLEDVVFPAAGTYEFVLHVGGQRQPVAPLHLLLDEGAEW